jgi:hypothetical protein
MEIQTIYIQRIFSDDKRKRTRLVGTVNEQQILIDRFSSQKKAFKGCKQVNIINKTNDLQCSRIDIKNERKSQRLEYRKNKKAIYKY